MRFISTRIAMAVTMLATGATALAEPADSKDGGTEKAAPVSAEPARAPGAKPMARVEIKGDAQAYDPRRDDTASKTVIQQEEIMKYGDTNVYDVLKRAPGVTVIGNSIRLRGLGNGYTQILVNGERPPPGFSMDALTPDQIEKIEVIRAATAEYSMQAIAGTINIVLKKVVAKKQQDARINTGRSDQYRSLFMMGTLADRVDNLSYYLNAMLAHNDGRTPGLSTDRFTTPQGLLTQARDTVSQSQNRNNVMGVQPRLNWKLADEGQLNVSGFLQGGRGGNDWNSAATILAGSFGLPEYTARESASKSRWQFDGGDINWVAKLGGGKLDAKWSMSQGRAKSDTTRLSATADNATRLRRTEDDDSHYTNYSTTGKYTRTLFDGHAMASGWEAGSSLTEEDLVRVEGLVGGLLQTVPQSFQPKVVRLAAYAQDEWNVTSDWSVYLGARWEGIRTGSEGTGLAPVRSRNHVLSPVAQTLYKFPDKSGRQLRMALTRTFKAPQTQQLIARRYEADINTRFTPDSSGNPNLRPELANGIDLTYEHFWAPGAVFSIGTSQRRIRDYIRTRLIEDTPGHWLTLPLNDGNATVRTLDLELKFPLKAVLPDAAPFDFRMSANRNWSKVDTVPGPDNRLDQQVPVTATLGVDYREDKFSAGASFAYRAGGMVRDSAQQFVWKQGRRETEAYLLYKVRTGWQWRFSVSNLLGEGSRSASRYVDDGGTSESFSRSPGSPWVQLNLEMKF